MSQEREYALVGGINRATTGCYLALVAEIVSSGIIFLSISALHLVNQLVVAWLSGRPRPEQRQPAIIRPNRNRD